MNLLSLLSEEERRNMFGFTEKNRHNLPRFISHSVNLVPVKIIIDVLTPPTLIRAVCIIAYAGQFLKMKTYVSLN